MKKYFLTFGLLLTVSLATVVFNSCGKDNKNNSPLEKQQEACAAKSHPDSIYTWKNNKCEAEYIGQKIDPNKEKITKLEKEIKALVSDSISLLNQARTALEPGLTNPENIKDLILTKSTPNWGFIDTLDFVIKQYEAVVELYKAFGFPAPNEAAITLYFLSAEQFKQVVAQLEEKRVELKQLEI